MTILLILDTVLASTQWSRVEQWMDHVQSEGIYRVEVMPFPRCEIADANRAKEADLIRSAIAARTNVAGVQILGAVAYPLSGWINPDGHGSRCFAADAIYGAPSMSLTDDRDWGQSAANPGEPLWSNMARDGRYDQSFLPTNLVPVARIDFAYLGLRSPSQKASDGCHAGQPVYPEVDEAKAFADYMARNFRYRRGLEQMPATGVFHGGLWQSVAAGARAQTIAAMPFLEWRQVRTDDAWNAPDRAWWYAGSFPGEQQWQFGWDCAWPSWVWGNTYRSFAMETHAAAGPLRRFQRFALVSTWGPGWFCPPEARTVADAILANHARLPTIGVHHSVFGDLTLPVSQPVSPRPAPPTNVRILE